MQKISSRKTNILRSRPYSTSAIEWVYGPHSNQSRRWNAIHSAMGKGVRASQGCDWEQSLEACIVDIGLVC
ncbi:unnamed protein product [Caretta caretta]